MLFNETQITTLYEKNLELAKLRLAELPIAEARKPELRGLSGWIYEQTIHYCLNQELMSRCHHLVIQEQASLGGHAKADLLVNQVAVELKVAGSFGNDEKYIRHRTTAEERGWKYCYLSQCESVIRYRENIERIFGKEMTFYLENDGEWERFVGMIEASGK